MLEGYQIGRGLGEIVTGSYLSAYYQWPTDYNAFLEQYVRVAKGGMTIDKTRAYLVDQIVDGIAKLSKYNYQITSVVKDPAVQAALKIEYDNANDMTSTFIPIRDQNGAQINDSNVKGIFRELNEWRGGITHLAQVIEAIPGVVGLGVSASKMAEQAKAAMLQDPAYQRVVDAGRGWPDQYWVLTGNQLYQQKVLEELAKILPSDSLVPIKNQIAANKESITEYGNSFTAAVEATSEAVPAFKTALDMAEGGWFDMLKNYAEKYKWWIAGGVAVLGIMYVSGKAVEGGFSFSAITANPGKKRKRRKR